jgi:hypothetical protein
MMTKSAAVIVELNRIGYDIEVCDPGNVRTRLIARDAQRTKVSGAPRCAPLGHSPPF